MRALTSGNVPPLRNSAGAELWLYDEIGPWGTTATDVATALSGLAGQRVTVRINSPGGSVFDGIAIYNLIAGHPGGADVVVDSLAASAASFIAMAGETVTMRPHSRMMIHDAIGACLGNAADMRETATLLDDLSDNIAGMYAGRSGEVGGEVADWRERMKAETWLSPEAAAELGLVDAVEEEGGGTGEDGGDGSGEEPDDESFAARWRASVTYQLAATSQEQAKVPARPGRRPAAAPRPAAAAVALDDIRAAITKGITR